MVRVFSVSCLAGALMTLSSVAVAESPNRVIGTWQMVSSKMDPDGANRDVMGPTPSGCLIFTKDMTFAVVVRDPSVPNFASPDRAKATAAENKAAVEGGLGLFGTYKAHMAEGDVALFVDDVATPARMFELHRTGGAFRVCDLLTELRGAFASAEAAIREGWAAVDAAAAK